MKAYAYDDQGFFLASFDAQIDPLESKVQGEPVYLSPPGTTFVEPQATPGEGEALMWTGKEWTLAVPQPLAPPESLAEVPVVAEPTPDELAAQEQLRAHQAAADGARARLLNARAEGITVDNAPAVLEDILVLLFGAK